MYSSRCVCAGRGKKSPTAAGASHDSSSSSRGPGGLQQHKQQDASGSLNVGGVTGAATAAEAALALLQGVEAAQSGDA